MAQAPIFLTHDGLTLTQQEWAQRLGISEQLISFRRRQGKPLAEVLTAKRFKRGIKPEHMKHPMLYCFAHERAWCRKYHAPPGWHPLPYTLVQRALWYAEIANCADQITIRPTRCDHCGEDTP